MYILLRNFLSRHLLFYLFTEAFIGADRLPWSPTSALVCLAMSICTELIAFWVEFPSCYFRLANKFHFDLIFLTDNPTDRHDNSNTMPDGVSVSATVAE